MAVGGERAGQRVANRAGRRPARRPAEGAIRLPTEAESVPVGRRWLRDALGREFGAGHPAIGDALQALSPVLTNAVVCGTGLHIRLTYVLDGESAEVAVHNEGADGARPQRQGHAGPDAEGGRGLGLVEAFSESWGIAVTSEEGIKVWFRVRFA